MFHKLMCKLGLHNTEWARVGNYAVLKCDHCSYFKPIYPLHTSEV